MRVVVTAEGSPVVVVIEDRQRGGKWVSHPVEVAPGQEAEIPDLPAGARVHVQEVRDAVSGAATLG